MGTTSPLLRMQTIYRHLFVDPNHTNLMQHISVQDIQDRSDGDLQEEGINKQRVQEAEKQASDLHVLNELIKKSNRCIIRISTQFPWTLLPNTISVEENRVLITFRQLLGQQSHGIDLKDISNVLLESSPFFATLRIISRTYIENEITVGHLNVKKANEVQLTIEGLRLFAQNDIDTSVFTVEELKAKINEFHTEKDLSRSEVNTI